MSIIRKAIFIIFILSGITAYSQSPVQQVIWRCDTATAPVMLCIIDGVYYFLSKDQLPPLKEFNISPQRLESIEAFNKGSAGFDAYTFPVKKYSDRIMETVIYIKLKKY
jgi:hypothetical protein